MSSAFDFFSIQTEQDLETSSVPQYIFGYKTVTELANVVKRFRPTSISDVNDVLSGELKYEVDYLIRASNPLKDLNYDLSYAPEYNNILEEVATHLNIQE